MRPLATKEVLRIWENSRNQSLLDKSINLLRVSCSGSGIEDPAALSIGERDAMLLQLREWLFGPNLLNVADCPECHEQVEWVTSISDLQESSSEEKTPVSAFSLDTDNYHIQFRVPNSYDIAKVISYPDYRLNPGKLLSDCIIEIQKDNKSCSFEDLPEEVLNKLDQRMAEVDPHADIRMVLNCPNCLNSWEMPFDIMSYLWLEIDNWARHILQDVAVLASTFGWSESEILSMSPERRRIYLKMIKNE